MFSHLFISDSALTFSCCTVSTMEWVFNIPTTPDLGPSGRDQAFEDQEIIDGETVVQEMEEEMEW
jgi:hypothetical protein